MLGASYGTVEDIEIMWVLVAAFGLVYSILNFKDAKEDFDFVKKNGIFNGRRVAAWVSFWSEMMRGAIQTIFLTIGLLVLMLPSPPPASKLPWEQVAAGFFVRWGLITSSILLSVKSYIARRARKEIEQGD